MLHCTTYLCLFCIVKKVLMIFMVFDLTLVMSSPSVSKWGRRWVRLSTIMRKTSECQCFKENDCLAACISILNRPFNVAADSLKMNSTAALKKPSLL